MSDSRDSDATFLMDFMNELSLKLVDTGPSHHGGKVDTWIDSIFVDNCDTILSCDCNLPTFPSRHEVISLIIDIFYPSPPKGTYTYKCFRKVTSQDLNSHLNKLDLSPYLVNDDQFDVELGLNKLTNNIQTTIDTLVPDKTIDQRKSKYPWINSELRLLKSKRDSTNRRYKRTGSRTLLKEFLKLVGFA